jgi:hypothetical protein
MVAETIAFEDNYRKYGPVFLDGTSIPTNIAITCFPRSGSNNAEKLIQRITGMCGGKNFIG